ncbi:MAG: sulfotransferase [Pseudomonadota bacterium]
MDDGGEFGSFTFLLGPHRSGTSLTASALHALGVSLGDDFISANADNPNGFFEDEKVINLNDRLLRSAGASWDSIAFLWAESFDTPRYQPFYRAAERLLADRFDAARACALKDPRFCVLLPFWQKAVATRMISTPGYIFTIRHPQQSVTSQRLRYIADSDFHLLGRHSVQVLLLWLTYVLRALRSVSAERLLIVDYDAMLNSPDAQLQRLADFLRRPAGADVLRQFSRQTLDRRLNRSGKVPDHVIQRHPGVWRLAEEVYQALKSLSSDDVSAERIEAILQMIESAQLDALYERELQRMYSYAYKKNLSLRHRLIRVIGELQSEKDHLAQAQSANRDLHERQKVLDEDNAELLRFREDIMASRSYRFLMFIAPPIAKLKSVLRSG